jgi:hypothetical protein
MVGLAVTAAALTALVVAAAVHARLTRRPSTIDPVPATAAAVAPPASSAPTVAPLPDGLSWTDVCGLRLPVSTRLGPRDQQHGLARGFAHEPGGAVLAALHLVARVSPQTGPDVFTTTLREQVTGPDTAAFADTVHSDYEQARERRQAPYGQPLCPIYATLRGFRLERCARSCRPPPPRTSHPCCRRGGDPACVTCGTSVARRARPSPPRSDRRSPR